MTFERKDVSRYYYSASGLVVTYYCMTTIVANQCTQTSIARL